MTHPSEARAMAHRHGPPSEHVNAEHMVKSGKAATNRAIVLAALREWRNAPRPPEVGGPTAGELANYAEMEPVEVRRRISDLKSAGMVWHGELRRCSVEGTPQHELMTATDAKQASLPL